MLNTDKYGYSADGKQLTLYSAIAYPWTITVFGNIHFSEQSTISILIVGFSSAMHIGAAVENIGTAAYLYAQNWAWTLNQNGNFVCANSILVAGGTNFAVNQKYTFSVNVGSKTIQIFKDDVNYIGPVTMSISDADVQKLRPYFQAGDVGNSVKIV